jgi:hypothetical protein
MRMLANCPPVPLARSILVATWTDSSDTGRAAMRLVKYFVLTAMLLVAGWLVAQSVSVDATSERLQITIDRQRLGAAGQELKSQGRRAVGKVGAALRSAGQELDEQAGASDG